MCLVLAAWRAHPRYRLIVAANRDEFYTRPTAPMRWWPERPGLLAGRDLGAPGGVPGTWLGLVPESGRFATVTNVRGPQEPRTDARSRGALLMDYLTGSDTPEDFTRATAAAPDVYNGYNLLVADSESLWWNSNRGSGTPMRLPSGLHGLSNAALLGSVARPGPATVHTDTGAPAWPKVRTGLTALAEVIDSTPVTGRPPMRALFEVLADQRPAPDAELPATGLTVDRERAFSARFVAHTEHGTRCSTVLCVDQDGEFVITERSFARLGRPLGEVSFTGRLRWDRAR
ncbi:MAG: NRDE family protein [Nocardia sp.]|nr:NRDE family protein [Nocardia sp.]